MKTIQLLVDWSFFLPVRRAGSFASRPWSCGGRGYAYVASVDVESVFVGECRPLY